MTEVEKMLAGINYNSRDPELLSLYHTARRLLKEYNSTESTFVERKQALLSQLLWDLGKGVWIKPPFFCDYGKYITIGDGSVVTQIIPENMLAFGNPCKVHRVL